MSILTVLLDLDGVACRSPYQHVVDREDKARLFGWLHDQEINHGNVFRFIPVTNRPAGHLQYVCYDWRVATGACIAENGSVAYFPHTNTISIHLKLTEYVRTTRPSVMESIKSLIQRRTNEFQEEPAGRHVGIEFVAYDREKGLPILSRLITEAIQPFAHQLRLEVGKTVVVYPKDCTKVLGLQWLLEMDELSHDWSDILWVADNLRDIPPAEFTSKNGGTVAAVGGSNEQYVKTIRELGGIVATGEYEKGLLEILSAYIQRKV